METPNAIPVKPLTNSIVITEGSAVAIEDNRLSVKPIRKPCIRLPRYNRIPNIARSNNAVVSGPPILCKRIRSMPSCKFFSFFKRGIICVTFSAMNEAVPYLVMAISSAPLGCFFQTFFGFSNHTIVIQKLEEIFVSFQNS